MKNNPVNNQAEDIILPLNSMPNLRMPKVVPDFGLMTIFLRADHNVGLFLGLSPI